MMAGKGRSPGGAAHYGSLEDFVVAVGEYPNIDWRQFLLWALKNDDLVARVEIANWMLDHGADPALVRPENINALHVLFDEREHDYLPEARLIQRFLDGGLDINLRSPKWSVPIRVMMKNVYLKDWDLGLFYDVIFSHPGIDWDAYAGKAFGEPWSLKQHIDHAKERRPELYRRMCDYLENGPSPRPVFS